MHNSSIYRMQWFVNNYANKMPLGNKKQLKVLDVGSYNINGSYKNIFLANKRYSYTGLDIEKGRGVDIALDYPYNWNKIETDFYDIVISGQTFEHTEFFWATMEEMVRCTYPGGLICIIAPREWHEHRFPIDCFRFLKDGMIALARWTNLEILHVSVGDILEPAELWQKHNKPDAMLIAKKPYSGIAQKPNLKTYVLSHSSD